MSAVHPRVGGEHRSAAAEGGGMIGSSPRGRGTRCDIARLEARCRFIPRGRGTQAASDKGIRRWRFIPAWAGNTNTFNDLRCESPVHPRVGGEHWFRTRYALLFTGSSPRGRGTPEYPDVAFDRLRFIPAWAGNTACPSHHERSPPVHPRVGGEHKRQATRAFGDGGSSPRGRGTRNSAHVGRCAPRFIPAWAGNTAR